MAMKIIESVNMGMKRNVRGWVATVIVLLAAALATYIFLFYYNKPELHGPNRLSEVTPGHPKRAPVAGLGPAPSAPASSGPTKGASVH